MASSVDELSDDPDYVQNSMASSVDELSEDPNHVVPVPTISFDTPIVELVESCLRWQSSGTPFVIKGIPLDGQGSTFSGKQDWLAKLTGPTGKHA